MNLECLQPYRKPNAFRLLDKQSNSFIVGEKSKEPEGIEICLVYVPSELRGKGIGKELLETGIAEINRIYPCYPIYLLAMPMIDCPMNLEELIYWYQKQGFVPVTGDHESKIMVYDPTGEIAKMKILPEE